MDDMHTNPPTGPYGPHSRYGHPVPVMPQPGQPVAPSTAPQLPPRDAGSANGAPPKKYVTIMGITKLNPEYQKWQAAHGQQGTTALHPEAALPVVSNMDDVAEWQEARIQGGCQAAPLAAETEATINRMQETQYGQRVGLSDPGAAVDNLGRIFAKHEAPMGLMKKLMALTEYSELEFIVDDSGSMGMDSVVQGANGRLLSRWAEAHGRIREMIEILAYVPTPPITIRFLNLSETATFQHQQGEPPESFIQRAYQQIDNLFFPSDPRAPSRPNGSTPILRTLQQSFTRAGGRPVARYLFCDGEPSGINEKEEITKMLKSRPNPRGTPITFLSCSNQPQEVEWMKEAEEIADYAAEYDNLRAEQQEVARDQGPALPFTKGFWLVGQLVGAMNPDDLDAMDESAPLTKYTLDNILGLQSSNEDYGRYFQGFLQAQRSRRVDDDMDKFKKSFQWDHHFQEFLRPNAVAKDLDIVRRFNDQLKRIADPGYVPTSSSQGGASNTPISYPPAGQGWPPPPYGGYGSYGSGGGNQPPAGQGWPPPPYGGYGQSAPNGQNWNGPNQGGPGQYGGGGMNQPPAGQSWPPPPHGGYGQIGNGGMGQPPMGQGWTPPNYGGYGQYGNNGQGGNPPPNQGGYGPYGGGQGGYRP